MNSNKFKGIPTWKNVSATIKSLAVVSASKIRRIVSGIFLGFGMIFAATALMIFVMPFIASIAGTYDGEAAGALVFYFLPAFFSCACLAVSMFVRGWREARWAHIVLACLFGIPLLVFVVGIIAGIFHVIWRKLF